MRAPENLKKDHVKKFVKFRVSINGIIGNFSTSYKTKKLIRVGRLEYIFRFEFQIPHPSKS